MDGQLTMCILLILYYKMCHCSICVSYHIVPCVLSCIGASVLEYVLHHEIMHPCSPICKARSNDINDDDDYVIALFSLRRKGLAFVNLNTPREIEKKVARTSKWECGAVEWNPHLSHAHMFANAVGFSK